MNEAIKIAIDNADFAARSALPSTMEYKIASAGRILQSHPMECFWPNDPPIVATQVVAGGKN